MINSDLYRWRTCLVLGALTAFVLVGCNMSNDTSPPPAPDSLELTIAQISSLDSTAHAIEAANPGKPELAALSDSVLAVLTAGVEAKRIDVNTNLTTAPLYFVGIHRTSSSASSSFSTWTIVGLDDPAHIANIVEASGFAQSGTTTPPSTVTGTIGDGTGIVNALLLQVGSAGAVTEWPASSGAASFTSSTPTSACPNFQSTATVTCSLETVHVHFTSNAGARQAAFPADVDIPAMRLSYSSP